VHQVGDKFKSATTYSDYDPPIPDFIEIQYSVVSQLQQADGRSVTYSSRTGIHFVYNTEDRQEVICYVLKCKHWECLKTRRACSDENQPQTQLLRLFTDKFPYRRPTASLHSIRTITNRPTPVKLCMRLVCASARLFHNQTRPQVTV
jgi:hypothetical protein